MQTWEYAPQHAIRTYAFVAPLLPFAWLFKLAQLPKAEVFQGLRLVLAALTAFAEAKFLRAVQAAQGSAAMRLTTLFLLFSPGVVVAATAFLPSAVIMSLVMLSAAAWLSGGPLECIAWGCVAVLLTGWPYVGMVFLPMGLHILHGAARDRGALGAARLAVSVVLLAASAALVAALVDRHYYGAWTFPSLNALRYNASGSGDNLYGVEPAGYYVRNLFLTMGLAWPLGCVAPVLLLRACLQEQQARHAARTARSAVLAASALVWLALLFSRPHKEERFMYPIYPLLAYCAAVSAVGFVDLVGSVVASLLREKPPLEVEEDFEEWARLADLTDLKEREEKAGAAWAKRRTWGYVLKTAAMAVCICGSITLCALRLTALQTNYGGYLSLWQDVGALLPLPPAGKASPKAEYTLCLGSEWYRFTSHFHLSDSVSLAFVKDNFGGQLPQYFPKDGTAAVQSAFNNQNAEEPSRYVDIHTCDYVVASIDKSAADPKAHSPMLRKMTILYSQEARHKYIDDELDLNYFEPVVKYNVLEPALSHSALARAYQIPGFSQRMNHKVHYTLYQRVHL